MNCGARILCTGQCGDVNISYLMLAVLFPFVLLWIFMPFLRF